MGKRIFDFVFALVGLTLLSPIFLVVAPLIKLTSPGSIFSRRQRVGKDFKPFYLYKFRTAVKEIPASITVAQEKDRMTRVGKFLRDLKIDELPQLINVLKGEMSLVGPRPEAPRHVEQFKKEYETVLQVRPGITDLASIELRDESALLASSDDPEAVYLNTILPKKIKLAKTYIQHQTFSTDLKILFSTLTVLFLSSPFPFSKGKQGGKKPLKEVMVKYRRGIVFFIHMIAILASNYFAFWLRFDGDIPASTYDLFVKTIPMVLLFRLVALHYFGLNLGLWRYASIQDLIGIVWAILVSSLGIWTAVAVSPWTGYPRSVYLIDASLLLLILASLRMIKRVYAILTRTTAGARRVLIIGAGNAGEMVARDMRRNPSYNRQPVAFIDDDPKKRRLKIHNIPVIGSSRDIDEAVRRIHPDEILIAIPSATPAQTKAMIGRCKLFGLPIKTLPNLNGILGGQVSVADIRSLDIEDLIGREEIEIHDPEVAEKIRGKRVLVTGAGGSIGSELCRQVAAFQPERLILFERSENSLHHIQVDLLEKFPSISLEVVLGDILNQDKLEQTFSLNRPQIVYHAAAYKHVPMMEMNPFEAVQNNIVGTYRVISAADRSGAEEVVLISTDKAVHPTSVMGATKRVAEMLVRYFNPQSRTKLVSVRFGNVLESNGSVVPLFRSQIRRGGPVKVTHPDIKRYFITIQEAVQLVLQAAVMGKGGEVFVLDMGAPIKIADLARTMIILSGLSPDEEVPIQFVGLRPGEKMTEELFEEEEEVIQTRHEKIRLAQNGKAPQEMIPYIEKFAAMDHRTDPCLIKALLKELIPTYSIGEAAPAPTPVAEASEINPTDAPRQV